MAQNLTSYRFSVSFHFWTPLCSWAWFVRREPVWRLKILFGFCRVETDVCPRNSHVQIHFALPIQFPKMQPTFTLQSSQVYCWETLWPTLLHYRTCNEKDVLFANPWGVARVCSILMHGGSLKYHVHIKIILGVHGGKHLKWRSEFCKSVDSLHLVHTLL